MRNRQGIHYFLIAALLSFSGHASATLNVFSCEPEWASLVQELGGDKVNVYSATSGMQDPHHIEARPSLIAKARNADLLICTGAELEIGWLPQVLQQAGNAKIQPGQPGNLEAAQWVEKIDIPTRLDRAEGDVHAAGNPHIQLDPRNIKLVAVELNKRLVQIDSANTNYYQQRNKQFMLRWEAAMATWEKQAEPLRGIPVVVHHKLFGYLFRWLGIKEIGQLEPKPGVEPTTAHLAELIAQLSQNPAKLVIRASYQDERASRWLADHAHLTAVALPATVGGSDQAKDLFGLFDTIIQQLRGAK